jgi:oxidase EvaA
MATLTRLRDDAALAGRVAKSAAARQGVAGTADAARAWFDRRRAAGRFTVDRIPFGELDGWYFKDTTGDLVHRSDRFFAVSGLRVSVGAPNPAEWDQPILCQPEIGILGILAREFDGVLHFLMQAKMEPGNPNLVQLSPTVQATRSNYTGVHRGAAVRYLEHFTRPERSRVLSDALQSEHGAWFLRKRNRNMIVEASGDVVAHEDFIWLTLGQIAELIRDDCLVNMDSRSVLAGLPAVRTSRALHSDAELLSWITAIRSEPIVLAERTPLASVCGWTRTASSIEHEDGRYFRAVAVAVQAGNREVAEWTQPLFEPRAEGVVAFLMREVEGVPHVLVRARPEPGFREMAELGPTVQCIPENYAHLPPAEHPPFLDVASAPDPARVRYSALHSEEGGRFLNAVSRYLLIGADESQAPLSPPPGFRWVSHGQLSELARHSHYVNVQARTLLACLNAVIGLGLSPA